MSSVPVDTGCTSQYHNSTTTCTASLAASLQTYPNYFGCANTLDPRPFCYAVANNDNFTVSADDAADTGLAAALVHCCSSGVFGGGADACVYFCASDTSIDAFNECLAGQGLAASGDSSGPLRATYCVAGQEDAGTSSSVTSTVTVTSTVVSTGRRTGSASTTSTSGTSTQSSLSAATAVPVGTKMKLGTVLMALCVLPVALQ